MLGAFFVLFIEKCLDLEGDDHFFFKIEFMLSALMIFYFCISYLVNESLENARIYNEVTFLCDCIEIILMHKCLSALSAGEPNSLPDLKGFFFFAMFIPVAQTIWNISLREVCIKYYMLNAIAFLLLFIAFSWGSEYPLFNYIFVILVSIILAYYLLALLLNDDEFLISAHDKTDT